MIKKQAEYDEPKWKCRHDESGPSRSFVDALAEEQKVLDKLRSRLSNELIGEICKQIHHCKFTGNFSILRFCCVCSKMPEFG